MLLKTSHFGMAIMSLTFAGAAEAAPPPPPPSYVMELGSALTEAPGSPDGGVIPGAFCRRLQVAVDNAAAIDEDSMRWFMRWRAGPNKDVRRTFGFAAGNDSLVVVRIVDDRLGLPTGNSALAFDPRYMLEVTKFSFGTDHLVHRIQVMHGGGFWNPVGN